MKKEAELTSEELQRTLQDLRLHQIELELQNEELRHIELELAASQARYFDLYNAAPIGYFLISSTGLVVEPNLALAGLLGMPRAELVKTACNRIVYAADQDRFYLLQKQLQATGEPQVCELRLVKHDDTLLWVQLSATLAEDSDGKHYRITLTDISHAKQVEEQLQHTLSLLNATLESTAEGLLAIGLFGNIIRYNQKFIDILRIPQERMAAGQLQPIYDYAAAQSANPDKYLARIREINNARETSSFDTIELLDGRLIERYSQPKKIADQIVGRVWSFRDVTAERRLAETNLLHCEDRFSKLFYQAPLGIGLMDSLSGKITEANPALSRIFGYSIDELKGRDWLSITQPGELQSNLELISQFNAGEMDGFNLEKRYRNKTGAEIWAHVTVTRLQIEAGERPRHLFIVEDVTARKTAEAALRLKEAHYRELFERRFNQLAELSRTYHWEIDTAGLFSYISPVCKLVLGYEPQAIIGKIHFYDLAPELEREAMKAAALASFACKDTVHNLEHRSQTADGRLVWVTTDAVPLLDAAGNLTGYSGTSSDITKEKTSRDELENFFAVNLDLLCIADFAGNFIKVNKAWEEILGYSVEELQRRKFFDFVHPDDMTATIDAMALLSTQQDLLNFTNRYRSFDGSYRYIEWRSHPVGELIYAAARDITERRLYEEKITYLSFRDVLTGLYNRRYFEEELRRMDTARQLPISVISGDVNGLKLTNDVFGHERGDELLRAAAQFLQASCREEDVVVRYGGDEFVAFLPRCDEATAEKIVERIRRKCRRKTIEGLPVSLALGVATKTLAGEAITAVVNLAETRMYHDKISNDDQVRAEALEALERQALERDCHPGERSARLRRLATRFSAHLQLTNSTMQDIALLAVLQDVGKIAVPEGILSKPGELTPEEWAEIKNHPAVSYRILRAVRELSAGVEAAVLAQHEHWNGSGYPKGLKTDDIPYISRLLGIVEAYDVMTHDRPYRKALSHRAAIEELQRCAGTQFDPQLVQEFVEFIAVLDNPTGMG